MKIYLWLSLMLAIEIHQSGSQNIFHKLVPESDLQTYGLALEAIFGMGLRLQTLLDDSTPHNFVVSPISATVIVGQLLLGAQGEFKDRLYELLSLPAHPHSYSVQFYNKNNVNESYTLTYAHVHLQLSSLIKKLQRRRAGEEFTLKQSSALFYNEKVDLKRFFKSNMMRLYDSEITPLDFSKDTRSIINDWSSSHTNGLITDVLPSPPGPSTSALFLNAIYFLAEWETPFSDMLNRDEPFYINKNETVTATYMQGLIEQIPYAVTKDYTLVCLPYKNKELGMYILLPNEDDVDKYNMAKFSDKLHPAELMETVAKVKIHDVIIKIPKLSLSNTLRLLEPLQKYSEFKKVNRGLKENTNLIDKIEAGINDYKNFTPQMTGDIYLTGAAKNADLKVSDIVQQMIFSINEKGTEAAAVTAGITDYMGGSKTVVLDRPFVFFISHEETKATIFWGAIVDPSQT